tara:strand:- start:4516 stop:5229 length:714 start_codon:yes stop_codon:yes gene_type:complete
MTKHISYEDFLSFTPNNKIKSDPLFCRFFYRPISFYVAYVLYLLNVKANQVSVFATLLIFPLVLCIYYGLFFWIISIAVIFSVLDCVDGNLARVERANLLITKRYPIGPWLDACSGYFYYAFVPITIGLFCEQRQDLFNVDGLIVFLSSLVSVTNLLIRLINQKLINELGSHESENTSYIKNIGIKFKGEVGFLGFMLPAYIIFYYFNGLVFLFLMYFLLYFGYLVLFYFKTLVKTQ